MAWTIEDVKKELEKKSNKSTKGSWSAEDVLNEINKQSKPVVKPIEIDKLSGLPYDVLDKIASKPLNLSDIQKKMEQTLGIKTEKTPPTFEDKFNLLDPKIMGESVPYLVEKNLPTNITQTFEPKFKLIDPKSTEKVGSYLGEKAKLGLMSFGEGWESFKKIIENKTEPFDVFDPKQLYREDVKKQKQEFAEAEKSLHPALKLTGDVIGGFTQMIPTLLTSMVNPLSGLLTIGGSAAGNAAQEATDSGASKEQALLYGLTVGGIEGAVEGLIGGLPFMKGIADKTVKSILKPIKSRIVKTLTNRAIDAGGEALEEIISGLLQPIAKRAIYDPKAQFPKVSELLYEGGVAAIIAGTLGLPSSAIEIYKPIKTTKDVEIKSQQASEVAQGLVGTKSFDMITKKPLDQMETYEKMRFIVQTRKDIDTVAKESSKRLAAEEEANVKQTAVETEKERQRPFFETLALPEAQPTVIPQGPIPLTQKEKLVLKTQPVRSDAVKRKETALDRQRQIQESQKAEKPTLKMPEQFKRETPKMVTPAEAEKMRLKPPAKQVEQPTQQPVEELRAETKTDYILLLRLKILEEKYSQQKDMIKNSQWRDGVKAKKLKALGMQYSAQKRELLQGDLLISVEGGLTANELSDKIKYLKSNYVGKEVTANGKEGKITGVSFGKIGVKHNDGTVVYYEKADVKPVEDIDALIEKQKAVPKLKTPKQEQPKQETVEKPKETQPETKQATEKPKKTFKPVKQKVSRFKLSLEKSSVIPKEIKTRLTDEEFLYETRSNKRDVETAYKRVERDLDGEMNRLLSDTQKPSESPIDSMEIFAVADKLVRDGRINEAKDFVVAVRPKVTATAQSLQALAIRDKLSPGGILITATKMYEDSAPKETVKKAKGEAKQVSDAMNKVNKDSIDDIIKKLGGDVSGHGRKPVDIVQKKIDSFTASVSEKIYGGRPKTSTDPYIVSSETRPDIKAARQISDTLGLDVIFIKPQTKTAAFFNGTYHNGTIFINANADNAAHIVLGHEVMEQLAKESPETFNEFVSVFKKELDNTKAAQYRKSLAEATKKELGKELTDEEFYKEAAGDFSGEMFNDPQIMTRLAKENPNIAEKIIQIVRDIISKLRAIVNPDYTVRQYLNDTQAVENAYVKATGKFVQKLRAPSKQGTEFSVKIGDVPQYSIRRNEPPQSTIKAYKLLRINKKQPGKLYPLFVDSQKETPIGVWLDAETGPLIENEKNNTLKVKSKLGNLAYRPGWHLGDIPLATHIGVKGKSGKIEFMNDNHVWVEAEVAADINYQNEANSTKSKDLKKIPVNGYYRFKTNPNMTGEWMITGSMKINRVLTDSEVEEILKSKNLKPMPRQKSIKKLETPQTTETGYSIRRGTEAPQKFQSPLDRIIKKSLRESGVDIRDIARKHYIERDLTGKSLSDKLTEQAGLTGEEAKRFADIVQKRFAELTESKKRNILNQLYKTRTPSQRKALEDRIIELSNMGAIGDSKYTEILYEKYGIPQLSDEDAKSIIKQAEQIQKMTDVFKRQAAINKMMAEIKSKIPAGVAGKLRAYTLVNVLLNPKTIGSRNILGNISQMTAMRINKYLMTSIDFTRSKLTGKDRTITFRTNRGLIEPIKQFMSDIKIGGKAGWEGYSPYGTVSEFRTATQQFRGKYNPLTYLEKALGASLGGAGDYPFYMKGVFDSIGEQSVLKAINEGYKGKDLNIKAKEYADEVINSALNISDFSREVLDKSNRLGEKATFRDPNIVSTILKETHDVLNVIGFGESKRTYAGKVKSKQYGVGDLAIFFSQTPGALLNIGFEYSPLGILKSTYHVLSGLNKARKGTGSIDYEKVTESITKAVTGTLLMSGFAAYLASKGAMTGGGTDDWEAERFLDEQGKRQYSVNRDAVIRWAKSLFKDDELLKSQEGDTWFNYDWLAPFSFNIALGADAIETLKQREKPSEPVKLKEVLPLAWQTGLKTLYNENTVRNLIQPFRGYELDKSVQNTLIGSATRFVPLSSILNMIRQMTDNVKRNVSSDDPKVKVMNLIKNRIPGLSKTLPAAITTTGNVQEMYQGGTNNFLNVVLNPAFVKKYKETPGTKLLIDLYESTGETKQFPRIARDTLSIYDQEVELTKEQVADLQQYIGYSVMFTIDNLTKNKAFNKLSDNEKIDAIYNVLNEAGDNAKDYMAKKLNIKKVKQRPKKPVPKFKVIRPPEK